MMPGFWESLIMMALGEVKQLWNFANKVTNGKIRTFDELLKANDDLQSKIDAEKQ